MNTIYKDGKPIIECLQYDGTNMKQVGDFMNENKIYWTGPKGGPYTVQDTHGTKVLTKTDWLLKRKHDFVLMCDESFKDTYVNSDQFLFNYVCPTTIHAVTYQRKPSEVKAIMHTGYNFDQIMATLKEHGNPLNEFRIGYHKDKTIVLEKGDERYLLNVNDWIVIENNNVYVYSNEHFASNFELPEGHAPKHEAKTVYNIPDNHSFKQVGSAVKSEPVLSREDQFVLAVVTMVNNDKSHSGESFIKRDAKMLMSVADNLRKENNAKN